MMAAALKKICLAAALAAACFALAQDEETPRRTEAGQVRLELTNALIKEIQSTKEVRYRVKWHYLPDLQADSNAVTMISVGGDNAKAEVEEYVFSNKLLVLGGLDEFITGKLKNPKEAPKWQRLLNALEDPRHPEVRSTSLAAALENGAEYWAGTSLFTKLFGNDVANPLYSQKSWFTILTAQQSFYAMEYLFGYEDGETKTRHSNGAGLILKADPEPRGANPRYEVDNLEWHIQVKSSKLPSAIDPGKQEVFYTFTVFVTTKEIRQTLRHAHDLDALQVHVTAGMLHEQKPDEVPADPNSKVKPKRLFAMPHPKMFDGAAKVEAIPEGVGKIQEFEDELESSVGSFTLGNIAGATPGGLIAPLFDNDSDAFPFYGSLIGGGPSAPMYGLNYVFSPDERGTMGFLYGFVANQDSALFLGPSLTWGPVTFAAGARVFNRDDDSVTARFSGGLAIDLNQLFGRSKTQMVEPRDSDNASFWPVIDRSEQLVLLRVNGAPVGTVFKVTKQKEEGENEEIGTYVVPVPGAATEVVFFPFASKTEEVLRVHAPPGYKFVGDDSALVDSVVISMFNEDGRVFTRTVTATKTQTVQGVLGNVTTKPAFADMEGIHEVYMEQDGELSFRLGVTYMIAGLNEADEIIVSSGDVKVALTGTFRFEKTPDDKIQIIVNDAPPKILGPAVDPITLTARRKE